VCWPLRSSLTHVRVRSLRSSPAAFPWAPARAAGAPRDSCRTSGRALASPVLAHAPSSALAPVLDAAFARTPGRRADAPTRPGRTSGRALASPSSLTHLQVRSLRSSRPPSPERPAGALTLPPDPAERPGVRWPLRSSPPRVTSKPVAG